MRSHIITKYLLSVSIAFVTLNSGCNFDLSEAINKEILDKLTEKESQFIKETLFVAGAGVEGSFGSLDEKFEFVQKKALSAEALFILFEYSTNDNPADFEEGVIFSDVGHMATKPGINKHDQSNVIHPGWTNIARMKNRSVKQTRAKVKALWWYQENNEKKLLEINIEYEWVDGSWKLSSVEDKGY